MPAKKTLLEVLEFLKYKVETNQCTLEEIRKFSDIAIQELDTQASIQEIAEFYGQTTKNVHNVLDRRPIPKDKKPKRKVYVSFNFFASLKPNSWGKKEER